MKTMVIILIALSFVLAAGLAHAATDTSALTASATVSGACSISSVTNLDFGTYDPTSATDDDDGVGDVAFTCTKGTTYDVYITGSRTMTDGTDTLNFEMYQDSSRTSVWPSAAPGVSGTAADNSTITKNIYGRITAQQDVGAGTYSGSVTVTVEY